MEQQKFPSPFRRSMETPETKLPSLVDMETPYEDRIPDGGVHAQSNQARFACDSEYYLRFSKPFRMGICGV